MEMIIDDNNYNTNTDINIKDEDNNKDVVNVSDKLR